MIYAAGILTLLLLGAAGLLAYRNSKLIAERSGRPEQPCGYSASIGPRVPDGGELLLRVQTGPDEDSSESAALFRVPKAQAEMDLEQAKAWMLHALEQLRRGGGPLYCRSYPEAARSAGERELVEQLTAIAGDPAGTGRSPGNT